jgi:hypothetical protein
MALPFYGIERFEGEQERKFNELRVTSSLGKSEC